MEELYSIQRWEGLICEETRIRDETRVVSIYEKRDRDNDEDDDEIDEQDLFLPRRSLEIYFHFQVFYSERESRNDKTNRSVTVSRSEVACNLIWQSSPYVS